MTTTPIAPQKYLARLEERLDHNERFGEYHFELVEPHTLPFNPGQFISINIGNNLWRSYSMIQRSDETNGFELLVDHEGNGVGVNFLRSLNFGDQIEVLAPLGNFSLSDSDAEGFTLVATGSGGAPLRSLLLELLQIRNEERPITLYWGMRYDHELFWLDDFIDLQKSFPNFTFVPIISQPSEEWNLSTGRVTSVLAAANLIPNSDYYLCGAPAAITEVREILQNRGVPSEKIKFEQY